MHPVNHYNGNEAILSSGTEGKPNDYFIYNSNDKQLKLVSKKNVEEIAATRFAECTAAIDKAKTVNGDLSQLKERLKYIITGTGNKLMTLSSKP